MSTFTLVFEWRFKCFPNVLFTTIACAYSLVEVSTLPIVCFWIFKYTLFSYVYMYTHLRVYCQLETNKKYKFINICHYNIHSFSHNFSTVVCPVCACPMLYGIIDILTACFFPCLSNYHINNNTRIAYNVFLLLTYRIQGNAFVVRA